MKYYEVWETTGTRMRHKVYFHDGVKTHKDGSPFLDLRMFTNKVARNAFCASLDVAGYSTGYEARAEFMKVVTA